MKILRRVLWIAGGLLALLLVAAFTLPLWFNADRFREPLQKLLTEQLGRPVTLGKLALKMRPLPTVSAEATTLADDTRGAPPLLSFEKAEAKVAFWPLLRKELRIRRVGVTGLVVNLERDRAGKLNIQRFLDGIPKSANQPAAGDSKGLALTLDELEFAPVEIRWTARGEKSPRIIPAALKVENFGREPVKIDLTLSGSRFSYAGRLDSAGLDGKFLSNQFRLSDMLPLLDIAGAAPSGVDLDGKLTLSGEIAYDFSGKTSPRWMADAELSGGTLKLPALKAPVTGLGFKVSANPEALKFTGITLKVLSSDLSGGANIQNWAGAPRITFDFSSERLELGELANQLQSGAGDSGGGGGAPGAFSARGGLRVKQGGFGSWRFSDLSAKAEASPATLRLRDLAAGFAGGRVGGEITLANRTGGFAVGVHGERIAVGEFLKMAAGGAFATGTASFSARATGAIADPLALSGTATFAAERGVIEKFPLIEQINLAMRTVKLEGVKDDELAYDRLGADFTLGDRRATTGNLRLSAPLLDLDGTGFIGFDLKLDLKGDSRLSEARSKEFLGRASDLKYLAGKDGRLHFPWTATGTADDPKVSVDATRMLKDAAKAEAERLAEEEKKKLELKAKDKARDFLGGLLGGKKKSAPASGP